ncbi:lipoprotein-anchoring transpeptidase ErfK/SrfK [Kitasatospora sp. MAA19]|uniref:L,D-transpeptidase n=1 Tax=Kitasatospora sp. MAA19 TaxID=3035090 RepID=UPI0024752150|nr:Ig-like domain-containing protein [Kitasatospora sp. MAA19]MDH6705308.1 lipoprotein-anchoring transpeptidase ErfK/SrfK [Kitasatospora sp. MAA19]
MTARDGQGLASGGSWSRRGVLAGLIGAPVLLLAACNDTKGTDANGSGGSGGSGGASGTPAGGGSASSSPKTSVAVITVTPADGAAAASFSEPVKVTVSNGTLGTVKVTDSTGKELAGQLAADGTGWTSATAPASGTKYTVAATALDKDKLEADANATFTTATPANTFVGYFTPEDGSVVGVGMPVSINFSKPVTDKKAVQQAITVIAEPGVEIVGHWFSSTRLDFRPQEYWAKGTQVTLKLRLKDVEGAKGVYGTQSKDVRFTIGRAQTSVADLATKKLTVTTDGQVSAVYKISGGAPDHRTWGGKMVISEQFQQTRMNSQTVNLGSEYDIADVPHAQRLTTSGTFIHGNYWSSPSIFGGQNTSHGCIGLRDAQGAQDGSTDGYKFYKSSMIGDVVEVANSGDKTVAPDNGLNGWNLGWAEWKAGSAI